MAGLIVEREEPARLSEPPRARMELVSFDGQVRRRQLVTRPDRYRYLETLEGGQRRIARGGGYSYAAAGFGAAESLVQDCSAFDRILAFDDRQGLLECEAGTTLGKIHAVASPRGWYLPVQPGYPRITVGGCIAADVHGKNQFQDGNFRNVVKSLQLFHPRYGVLQVDRERNAEALDLTCGGLGLTGQILSAQLQLARLPGQRVRVRRIRISRFEEVLSLLEEHAPRATFIYTWHDFSARGAAFGRGFLYAGEFLSGSVEKNANRDSRPVVIDAQNRGRWRLQLLNALTAHQFNAAYGLWQSLSTQEREMGIFPFLFPAARKVAYFKLFGARGFREYQFLVPRESFGRLAESLSRYQEVNRTAITLASCKLFRGEQSQLRFDGDGICIALDFPSGPRTDRLFPFLDDLVRGLGGWPNLVKDSRLPREVVRDCYPEYESFRQALRRFDPERLYVSELSERLDL
jgi:decaprenylphospho-beta-D-ribofuranose 2-oxidase